MTCGGLCPGLNTVIREIVYGLHHMYGISSVLGIEVSNGILRFVFGVLFPCSLIAVLLGSLSFYFNIHMIEIMDLLASSSYFIYEGRLQRFLCSEYNSFDTQGSE